jgi:hypothetical protein
MNYKRIQINSWMKKRKVMQDMKEEFHKDRNPEKKNKQIDILEMKNSMSH